MGWERKRGKLHELNRLLRGAVDTTFMSVGGKLPAAPEAVRYVITLDADTRMPRESARRLIGKMAHPLNQPKVDSGTRRVVDGHGVLQPRVTPSLPIGREGSLFQRIFSGMSGIDPYSAAASDVYQDLFGEGSYTGKGIYEVDAFTNALDGRVPDNTLLSHDLFEGTFARSGLASDIEVLEEFPSRYDVAAARQHRWARGDWQLLPWIFRRTYAASASGTRAVPPLGRWKMLDNLRRSLSAPASVIVLVVGWTLPLGAAVVWTGFIVSTFALSNLLPVLAGIVPQRARITAHSHLRALAVDAVARLFSDRIAGRVPRAPAWLMTDAMGRTLFRLIVSRRHLLDWVTADQARLGLVPDLAGFYRQMNGGVAIGVAAAVVVGWFGREVWASGRAIRFRLDHVPGDRPLGKPLAARGGPCAGRGRGRARLAARGAPQLAILRDFRHGRRITCSRRTISRKIPGPVVAHRTSPTNVGLYLLSAVCARDFGWTGKIETVERLEATFATMDRLQRFRGHFYNWYDTRDLRPLEPQYVSSVDSGNLAGHLIALANACREWADGAIADPDPIAGIEDALNLTRVALRELPDDRRTQTITRHQLHDALDALDTLAVALRRPPPLPRSAAPEALVARLAQAAPLAATMLDIASTLARERGDDAGAEVLLWAQATVAAIESHRRDRCADRQRRTRAETALRGAGDERAIHGHRDGLRLSARSGPQAARNRLSRRGGRARPELLRPARLRGAPGELRRDREGRRRVAALVPARAGRDAGPPRRGADFLVGIDVRVPDAFARHARTGREPSRADEPSRRRAADQLWRHARCALGNFGIRL
jgi:cyclic beta-1,2-glucan synthetase